MILNLVDTAFKKWLYVTFLAPNVRYSSRLSRCILHLAIKLCDTALLFELYRTVTQNRATEKKYFGGSIVMSSVYVCFFP